jgi:hypothetical protein
LPSNQPFDPFDKEAVELPDIAAVAAAAAAATAGAACFLFGLGGNMADAAILFLFLVVIRSFLMCTGRRMLCSLL